MVEQIDAMDPVVQDALVIREIYKDNPVETPDLTDPEAVSVTEESVIAALRMHVDSNFEVLRQRDRYLRFVRLLLRPGVDPKV